MGTPLQQKAYLLGVLTVKAGIAYSKGSGVLLDRMVLAGVLAGASVEEAVAAPSREVFRKRLFGANEQVRVLKFWIRLLDDCSVLPPETATELHDAAEEVHRLVLASLRSTS
ncbi:MAG: four helix bundle protein [bacterium]|nr:four helix bundle protein [bacterium]